jgi:hypothetical protein
VGRPTERVSNRPIRITLRVYPARSAFIESTSGCAHGSLAQTLRERVNSFRTSTSYKAQNFMQGFMQGLCKN